MTCGRYLALLFISRDKLRTRKCVDESGSQDYGWILKTLFNYKQKQMQDDVRIINVGGILPSIGN